MMATVWHAQSLYRGPVLPVNKPLSEYILNFIDALDTRINKLTNYPVISTLIYFPKAAPWLVTLTMITVAIAVSCKSGTIEGSVTATGDILIHIYNAHSDLIVTDKC